eukprot:2236767-Ditylum_brightwellii.AAC.1
MLGMRKAATLQETVEKVHLHKKTIRYIKAISACPLKAHEVWISYHTVLNKSITYSLACTLFTPKEMTSLHHQILPILLSWLGYQQNFPRDIAFGTTFAGGIGCTHYAAIQLSSK